MKADKKRHGRRVSILLIITLLFSMVLPAAVFAEDGESVKYSETITINGAESYGMVRVDETEDPLTLSYTLDDDKCYPDNVTWSSSDESVATIAPVSDKTNRAVVTPYKAGKTTITVTQQQPDDVTISDEVEITVRNTGIFSLAFDLDDYYIEGRDYYTQVYIQEDEWSGDGVTWESSDESVMTVNPYDNGRYVMLYAEAPGDVTITARSVSNPDIAFDSKTIHISDNKDLAGLYASADDSEIAEGGSSIVKPRIWIYSDDSDDYLEEGQHFEIVEYLDEDKKPLSGEQLQEGEYYVHVKGIDPYHGEKTISFYVFGRNSLSNNDRFEYDIDDIMLINGKPESVLEYSIYDEYNGVSLNAGSDFEEAGYYEVNYDEEDLYVGDSLPSKTGYYYLFVKGINEYSGEMKMYFHVYETKNCGDIKAGVPQNLEITYKSSYIYRFVPVNTGNFTFYSSSDEDADPKLELYENSVDSDDSIMEIDDEKGHDFYGTINLTKGKTYYLKIYAYDSGKTTINIIDHKAAENAAADKAAAEKAARDAAAKKAAAEKAAAAQKLQAYNSAKASAQVSKVTKPKTKAKAKKKAKVTWKTASGAAGYEIQYSLKKNFKKAKTVTVNGGNKKKATLKKLKPDKKYFVRIRPFTNVINTSGKTEKVYGKWTKTMKIKAKE